MVRYIQWTEKVDEDHETMLPRKVPPCACKPYTKVATMIISNAPLSAEYFNLPEDELPHAVCVTETDKAICTITVVSEIAGDGV